jgi:hypothetical protein
VPYPIVVVATRFLPPRLLGISLGVAIVIHRNHGHDEATIVHELVHCRQFWRQGLVFHFLRYWLNANYRLKAEVEAFQAELELTTEHDYKERLSAYSASLAHAYRLNLSVTEARNLLDIRASQHV